MPIELCSRCGEARNMRVSTTRREVRDAAGNPRHVVTRTLHCETCNTFVRSEDVEEAAATPPDESAGAERR